MLHMRPFSPQSPSLLSSCVHMWVFVLAAILLTADARAQVDTEFWFAAPEVSVDGSTFDRPITLRIATLTQASTVTVSQPANPGFVPITVNVGASATASIDLTPWIDIIENKPPNTVLDQGLRITATAPVSIYYEIVSQQCLCNPEIFALKGMNGVGTAFIVPFQTFLNNGGGYNPVPYSSFDIVATEDNTTVTITPTQALVGHPAGVAFTVNLNRGQTWSGTATSQAAAQHPSGTVVTSDRPIAITIKDDLLSGAPYGGCADLMGDQIVPIERVGEEYIVMKGGLNGPDRVFVVGTQNGTTVTGAGAGAGTVNAGQTLTVDINAASTHIVASAPVYVLHLSGFGCEVGGALLPPIICTGSDQLGFTRSTNENFAMNLMTRSGYEGGFTINGNAALVPAGAFQPVPNTNGDWMAAQIYFTTAQIAAGSGNVIANSLGKFHMGIIHGSGGGGTRYGYFSDFNAIDPPIVASALDVCEGQDIQLTAQSSPNATFDWTGPDGFVSTEQNPVIPDAAPVHQGDYTVIAELDGCVSEPADVTVTVEDCACVETVTNGGFEQPVIPDCWNGIPQSQVPEWRTSNSFGSFEVWNGACMGVPAYEGDQFAEMDQTLAPYYMDVCTECAEIVNWGLAHRGRNGVDVMGLEAGPPGGPYVPLGTFTDGNTAWGYYTGTYTVPAGQDVTRFIFTFISVSDNAPAMGNLLDAVTFEKAVIPIHVSASICEGNSYELPGGDVVTAAGIYTDTLVSSAGCDSVIVTDLSLLPLPMADAGEDAGICPGESVQLNGTGGVDYAWLPVESLSAADIADPIATPAITNDYELTVTDANGCTDRDSVTITVHPQPVAAIDPIAEVCLGNATVLSHSSTGSISDVEWIPENGISETDATVFHTYSADGDYQVIINVVDTNGCVDSDTATATVLPLPQPDMDIQDGADFCENETIQFNALNADGMAAYAWNFNHQQGLPAQPGFSSPQQNPSFTYNQFGSYNVRLLVLSQAGCVGDAVRSINVHDVPVADFSFNVVCEGENMLLTSLSTTDDATVVNGWQWDVGDGTAIQYGETYVHLYDFAGTYPVELIVQTSEGCRDTIVQDVWVNPTPVIGFTGNDVCLEDETIFVNSSTPQDSTIISWEWDFGNGQTVQTVDAALTYAAFGTYNVTLTAETDSGCTATGSGEVSVFPNPAPAITLLVTEGCEPLMVPMISSGTIAQGSIVSHEWDLGDGNQGSGASLTHVYQDTLGTFDLTLTVISDQGCESTITEADAVTVNVTPVADFSQNETVLSMLDPLLVMTDLSQDALLYSWTFGDGSTSTVPSPSYRYSDPGEYDITLLVRNGECTDMAQSKVIVEPLFTFYIPNAFTPNANGRNDRFLPQGEGYLSYNMTIFDRWGEVIFQGVEAAGGWDGTYKGADVSNGAYVYHISVIDWTGESHTYTGKLMLVR